MIYTAAEIASLVLFALALLAGWLIAYVVREHGDGAHAAGHARDFRRWQADVWIGIGAALLLRIFRPCLAVTRHRSLVKPWLRRHRTIQRMLPAYRAVRRGLRATRRHLVAAAKGIPPQEVARG